MNSIKGFIIAGTHSGCGKTSVTLGLMAALARKNLKVQPFKTGPDFIDPGHHTRAAGRTCHNLDGWMLSGETLRDIFSRYSQDADASIVEGVMGLFDGYSALEDTGSTAHLSKELNLPVILVIDARAMARSAAALILGFCNFDPETPVAGVIFNRVGSKNHEQTLREAISLTEIPLIGCLPRRDEIATPSRHLGLVTPEHLQDLDLKYNALADWVEENLDLDLILESLPDIPIPPRFDEVPMIPRIRIGVARDEAFSFYYEENLRILRESGAELIPFSPTSDKELPEGISGLYLGGGYPELSAFDLAQNTKLRRAVAEFSASGKPVYAECGGFMYLMESICKDDRVFPMCGVFPFRCSMQSRFQALGYREIELSKDSVLGPAGTIVRGHEFHYSALEDMPDSPEKLYLVSSKKNIPKTEGFTVNGNTLGSYIHLHFASNPEVARNFVEACVNSSLAEEIEP
ncbi:cobyrinate a,c-diamide synthase [Maridesulfovibrio hydrothermalis]|uniref:Cobyrinate a,c-diamide synthase n=1 Tax=Maridesulfovibrio hydrothermalis AM13 = DSM 14728 TaxID=1121451 RepID=L0RAY9_9BACT|nr:cobyrinate a,c-diamide synthase [Maridesulfovibrio hydrothermalis]CCO22751.1 Cobyrinic acid A,C-diamide synthase [Maridesulfovibrio hydrothermalis AM13 = DSM 14728]